MQVLNVGGHTTVVFTTVVDELTRGVVDEDEDAKAAPTDRAYWEDRASKATVALADDLLKGMQKFDPALTLKFNKFYIGLARDGQALNFVTFRPKRKQINLEIRLPRSEIVDAKIEAGDLETLEYNKRWGAYRIRLTDGEIAKNRPLIQELMKLAYDYRVG